MIVHGNVTIAFIVKPIVMNFPRANSTRIDSRTIMSRRLSVREIFSYGVISNNMARASRPVLGENNFDEEIAGSYGFS